MGDYTFLSNIDILSIKQVEISKPMTPLWPCEVKSQKEQISFQEGSIVRAKAPSTTHPLIDSTSCDPIPVRTLKDKCISSQVATERLTNYVVPLAVCLLKTYVISCPANAALSLTKISSKTSMIESCPSDVFPRSKGPSFTTNPNKCTKKKGKPHQNDHVHCFILPPQKK